MNNLIINQSNLNVETVSIQFLENLYNTTKQIVDSGGTVDLSGHLVINNCYYDIVNWLQTNFPNLIITVTGGYYVKFKDPVVKQLMINAYSQDGIGVLSSDVTDSSLSINFQYNNDITSFDELSQFTNIIQINSSQFDGCSSLQSIRLDNIQTISSYAFRNCSSLTSIGNTNNVKYLSGKESFNGCKLTGKLSFPGLISIYGQDIFKGCNTTEFDISQSSLTKLNIVRLFDSNYKLTTIKLPDTITSVGVMNNSRPFNNCLNVTTITGVKGITEVNNILCGIGLKLDCIIPLLSFKTGDTFPITATSYNNAAASPEVKSYSDFNYNDVFIPQIYMPQFQKDTRTKLEQYYGTFQDTFFGYRSRGFFYINLLYLRDIMEIGQFFLYNTSIKNLVINKTTPPVLGPNLTATGSDISNNNHTAYNTWVGTMFGDILTSYMTIYVPDSAVSTYQANSYYNSYTIKGISELTTYATEEDWINAGKPENGLVQEYM